jgi:hypothetical protein
MNRKERKDEWKIQEKNEWMNELKKERKKRKNEWKKGKERKNTLKRKKEWEEMNQ